MYVICFDLNKSSATFHNVTCLVLKILVIDDAPRLSQGKNPSFIHNDEMEKSQIYFEWLSGNFLGKIPMDP